MEHSRTLCFTCLAPTLLSVLSTEVAYRYLDEAEVQDFFLTPHYVTDILGLVCYSYKLTAALPSYPP